MERDELLNYSNSYVNIPIPMLKYYWMVSSFNFDWFLINVIAFGTATEQLIRLVEDGHTWEGVTSAAEDNLDSIMEFAEEWDSYSDTFCELQNCKNVRFYPLVQYYKKWIEQNGGENWTAKGGWVGITVYNLRKMIRERIEWSKGVDKRVNPERGAQKWMIYFGLKSVIGQKKYFECSWDCILNRSLGFISEKDYGNANLDKQDWTMPFRTKRKTKIKMIERLIEEFNLVYTPTGQKGCTHRGCRWGFKQKSKD